VQVELDAGHFRKRSSRINNEDAAQVELDLRSLRHELLANVHNDFQKEDAAQVELMSGQSGMNSSQTDAHVELDDTPSRHCR